MYVKNSMTNVTNILYRETLYGQVNAMTSRSRFICKEISIVILLRSRQLFRVNMQFVRHFDSKRDTIKLMHLYLYS